MLIIKRKGDEAITIEPMDGADQSQTVEQLFMSGPIEITLLDVGNNQVKVAIEAPPQLKIWRGLRRRESVDVPDEKDAAQAGLNLRRHRLFDGHRLPKRRPTVD